MDHADGHRREPKMDKKKDMTKNFMRKLPVVVICHQPSSHQSPPCTAHYFLRCRLPILHRVLLDWTRCCPSWRRASLLG